MIPLWVAAVFAGGAFALSVGTSMVVVGLFAGKLRAEVDTLKKREGELATKEQLNLVSRDVAEIKGMFRITLKPEHREPSTD